MPIKRDDSTDYEALEAALMVAMQKDKQVAEMLGHRLKTASDQEDEIIQKYANAPEMKLSNNPSLLEIMMVMAFCQGMLDRVTEIELESIRTETRLNMIREPIVNNILSALGSTGSAESRRAKASSCTEVMNRLLTNEAGLRTICDVVRKNVKNAWESAKSAQAAIKIEVEHLGGGENAKELLDQTRMKLR